MWSWEGKAWVAVKGQAIRTTRAWKHETFITKSSWHQWEQAPERGYGYCKLQNCGRAPKPAGAQMTLPMAMDAEQQATGCGVLSTRFWPHSGPVFPCYTSILPFQMGLFNSLFYIASCTLFLDFKRAHSKVITLSLGRDFGVLNSVELLNYKDLRSWRGCLLNTETATGLQGPRRNITDWVWSIPHRFMYLNIWSPICDAVFFLGGGSCIFTRWGLSGLLISGPCELLLGFRYSLSCMVSETWPRSCYMFLKPWTKSKGHHTFSPLWLCPLKPRARCLVPATWKVTPLRKELQNGDQRWYPT